MAIPLRAPTRKPLVLRPVRPNIGLQMAYKRELEKLIAEMTKSLDYWLSQAYKTNQPEMALDASPAVVLKTVMSKLASRWQKRFDEAAPSLAKYFATAWYKRSDAQLRQILKDGGFSVAFKMTRPMNDVLRATVTEQVGLITNLSQQHLSQIEGAVMRSVAEGRDLFTLSKYLQKQHGITMRRAALIARDQNNKATANLQRVRQTELGITEAVWMHSHAGKTPRPTHVANDGKKYNIAKGWYDPAVKKRIWPGTEINCRCIGRSVVPGFED
jgi:SPP1 gp7 family putative phage head morphogenesis protein